MKKLQSEQDYESLKEQIQKERDPQRIIASICGGSGCAAYGTPERKGGDKAYGLPRIL
jgi:hypothetical protein